MRPHLVTLLIAGTALAQGPVFEPNPPPPPPPEVGVEFSVGWEGEFPIGWDTWTVEVREAHLERMRLARIEFFTWFDTIRVEHPEIVIVDPAPWFVIFERSVNAGFTIEVSMDLVQTFVVERVPIEDATVCLKTTTTQVVQVEADNPDPQERQQAIQNVAAQVKTQVKSGVRGPVLTAAVQTKVQQHVEQRKVILQEKKQQRPQQQPQNPQQPQQPQQPAPPPKQPQQPPQPPPPQKPPKEKPKDKDKDKDRDKDKDQNPK